MQNLRLRLSEKGEVCCLGLATDVMPSLWVGHDGNDRSCSKPGRCAVGLAFRPERSNKMDQGPNTALPRPLLRACMSAAFSVSTAWVQSASA